MDRLKDMEKLLGKTLSELQEIALSCGLKKFAGKQLAEWIYVRRATSFDEMTNISLAGRKLLTERYEIGRKAPVAEAVSKDGTRKYLFEVEVKAPNGEQRKQFVESVFIPVSEGESTPEDDSQDSASVRRATLCVSTQAGCRMGCRFCMTGTLGFRGQLSAADILNQIFSVPDSQQLTNLVYMGEGEPMDNISNILRSLQIMSADYGCAWSPRRITVSTVGAGEGLDRFLKESECNLAISLHNPFADERAEIMPAEKLRNMRQVLNWVGQHDFRHQRRLSFEYIVWGGKNDSMRYARELVNLLKPFSPHCRVNLIRFHEDPDPESRERQQAHFPATNEKQMQWLADYLNQCGVTTTIRRSRGEDILAACGMLVNALENK
ncbi:MAG: 23S rRNA (adenine(2503)-C(2))-methyltransferase RlmN [Bacteroidales bacterium]|nr:23S rRNA (adenine(2503)-C(2))-methyltransferase RlmN [Candidatus Colicola faecequi]